MSNCNNNNLSSTDDFINNMVKILIDEGSDEFWKCLKYDTTDALINPSYFVTIEDKRKMVKQNTDDTKIKRLRFNGDISTDVRSEIRIFEESWREVSPRIYEILFGIDIISHNKIIVLDGTGQSRLNVFRNEILRLFRGRIVDGNIGELSTLGQVGNSVYTNTSFQGYHFTLEGTFT